jgi:hypothetical protein
MPGTKSTVGMPLAVVPVSPVGRGSMPPHRPPAPFGSRFTVPPMHASMIARHRFASL